MDTRIHACHHDLFSISVLSWVLPRAISNVCLYQHYFWVYIPVDLCLMFFLVPYFTPYFSPKLCGFLCTRFFICPHTFPSTYWSIFSSLFWNVLFCLNYLRLFRYHLNLLTFTNIFWFITKLYCQTCRLFDLGLFILIYPCLIFFPLYFRMLLQLLYLSFPLNFPSSLFIFICVPLENANFITD